MLADRIARQWDEDIVPQLIDMTFKVHLGLTAVADIMASAGCSIR